MLPTKFQFICPSGFRGKDFFINQPIKNKNCLWRPCLLMDRDEMCNLHRGPSIDASYQVLTSFGLAVSEEKIKMWKVNGRQMTDAKWWQKLTLPLARWAKMYKQWSTKHTHQTKDRVTRIHLKTAGELRRISSSCSPVVLISLEICHHGDLTINRKIFSETGGAIRQIFMDIS